MQSEIAPTAHTPHAATKTIAYVMSRFPKISETFILYEILEIERLGMQVEVFPLVREHEQVAHPEAQAIVDRAHYSRVVSRAVLAAQFYWLLRRPRKYLSAWWHALRGNLRSPKFLIRGVAIVAQSALFARQMQALGVQHVHAHYATHPALAAYVAAERPGLPKLLALAKYRTRHAPACRSHCLIHHLGGLLVFLGDSAGVALRGTRSRVRGRRHGGDAAQGFRARDVAVRKI